MSKLMRNGVPRKDNGDIDWTPRRHHGWTGFIMVLGFLFPPLAVCARFGVGTDFFINLFLTICGYFPGHGHNFFVQNIRNNDNHPNRTPKWAKRYGLVDDAYDKRRAKKRAWTGRYNDQLSERRMYDDNGNPTTYDYDHRFEDGDAGGAQRRAAAAAARRQNALDGEQFYGEDAQQQKRNEWDGDAYDRQRNGSNASLGAGDDGLLPGAGEAARRKAKKKSALRGRGGKKDRHARTDDIMGTPADEYGAGSNEYSGDVNADPLSHDLYGGGGGGASRRANGRRPDSLADSLDDEGPEDPVANYGRSAAPNARSVASKRLPDAPTHQPASQPRQREHDIMAANHEF
ncbi:hypothetical protein IE81DRAFT_324240 [Ceraceosorus guamensis]|uniref:Uncharacterized protein n=1 Tax=Ceraceosorus guamensis TaxID=1522189 RepID=A0A316VVW1_9BASI|nr:hypothetical protein IE81DRAFT_324240 [Ceraceosorus guamensis]PWN41746.1 hypothetical protein IE81DRAFT_324240 [Ceraceosorus guamensis]